MWCHWWPMHEIQGAGRTVDRHRETWVAAGDDSPGQTIIFRVNTCARSAPGWVSRSSICRGFRVQGTLATVRSGRSPSATQRAPSPPLLCLAALCKCYEGTTGGQFVSTSETSRKKEEWGMNCVPCSSRSDLNAASKEFSGGFHPWKCPDICELARRYPVMLFTYCQWWL